jgi:hypothetical protein
MTEHNSQTSGLVSQAAAALTSLSALAGLLGNLLVVAFGVHSTRTVAIQCRGGAIIWQILRLQWATQGF